MWKLSRKSRGLTITEVTIIVVILGGIAIFVVDISTCDSGLGICTSQNCTNEAPCSVDLNGDGKPEQCIVGTACTNPGTICEPHWFTKDCACATVAGQAQGSCAAVCRN